MMRMFEELPARVKDKGGDWWSQLEAGRDSYYCESFWDREDVGRADGVTLEVIDRNWGIAEKEFGRRYSDEEIKEALIQDELESVTSDDYRLGQLDMLEEVLTEISRYVNVDPSEFFMEIAPGVDWAWQQVAELKRELEED
jgi:hypothetical protein